MLKYIFTFFLVAAICVAIFYFTMAIIFVIIVLILMLFIYNIFRRFIGVRTVDKDKNNFEDDNQLKDVTPKDN